MRLRCHLGQMWSCGNFCLLCLNACGTLIKHSGLAIKFWDTSDVLVRIAEAFIAQMSKSLVPQQLLSSRPDCADRDGFVNNKFEASKIDPFLLVRHCSKCVIELLMFCGFDNGNFCIDRMFTDVNK